MLRKLQVELLPHILGYVVLHGKITRSQRLDVPFLKVKIRRPLQIRDHDQEHDSSKGGDRSDGKTLFSLLVQGAQALSTRELDVDLGRVSRAHSGAVLCQIDIVVDVEGACGFIIARGVPILG